MDRPGKRHDWMPEGACPLRGRLRSRSRSSCTRMETCTGHWSSRARFKCGCLPRQTSLKHFAFYTLTFLVVPAALAEHQTFVVNPDGSEVKMTLKTTHELVNGTFHIQSGVIDFDPSIAKIGGNVVVAAGTGETGNHSRDKRMNKEILNVQQYTTISFLPKSYTGTIAAAGDSTIQVTGVLTLLGVPHDLTIPLQIHMSGGNCSVRAHFVVPYVQWGLKDPSFLVWKAEKQVDLELNLVGHVS